MDNVQSRTLAKQLYRIHLLIYRLAVCTEQIMSTPTGRQVRQLYRDLLRYGRQLQFTDKDYFVNRIRKEFKQAKDIEKTDDIIFYFQVSNYRIIGIKIKITVIPWSVILPHLLSITVTLGVMILCCVSHPGKWFLLKGAL